MFGLLLQAEGQVMTDQNLPMSEEIPAVSQTQRPDKFLVPINTILRK